MTLLLISGCCLHVRQVLYGNWDSAARNEFLFRETTGGWPTVLRRSQMCNINPGTTIERVPDVKRRRRGRIVSSVENKALVEIFTYDDTLLYFEFCSRSFLQR